MPLADAAYDPASERLIKALVDARILLSSGSEQNATIRLAHQRVLENWHRAKEIVAANAEFYRIRDDVEALRRRWEKSSKKRDLLIPKGVPLAEAESIAKRYPGELGAPALGFIAASGKRARLRQRLVAATAVVFAVLAVGATVAGIRAWQAEQAARRNFDIAKALVTDIASGLRNVEGMRAESRKKIFDQVSKTLDEAVAEAPGRRAASRHAGHHVRGVRRHPSRRRGAGGGGGKHDEEPRNRAPPRRNDGGLSAAAGCLARRWKGSAS